MKNIYLLLILFFFASPVWAWEGIVKKVSDGDTVWVETPEVTWKVRLAGIDAPEKKQEGGQESKAALEKLILYKKVTVVPLGRDKYRRVLGKLAVDGLDVQAYMIQNGYAWHYLKYDKNSFLQSLEEQARLNKIGIWSKNNPVEPWLYRKNK